MRGEPDYSAWNGLLARYYDSASGLDYAGLKQKDAGTLRRVREALGRVDAASLTPRQRLAYWINVYNVNVVAAVVEHYPVQSVLDISSNPLIRHDAFKRPRVPVPGGLISLDDVENGRLREPFEDPRIHFAINCAAKSCPPIRHEAYTGERVDAQLDDQVRRFAAGPGVRIERSGDRVILRTTKIMKWFSDDFDEWGGGVETFLRRYLPAEKAAPLASQGRTTIEYDDYDWDLNEWRR